MGKIAVVFLAWFQLGTALALLGMTIWLLHDAQLDWMVAKTRREDDPTVYEDGLGKIRIAALRFIDALLLCIIGLLLVQYSATGTVLGRLALVSITWVQMLKIITDRLTRMSVLVSAVQPSKAIEETMRVACAEIRDLHREVRSLRHEFERLVDSLNEGDGGKQNVRN